MLKRAFAAILVLAVSVCLNVPAWADLLWEPDDDFYWHHYGPSIEVYRMYYTNGDEGCVVAYTKPAGEEPVAVLPNGCEMFVSAVYRGRDGAYWGVIQFEYDEGGKPVPNYGPPSDVEYFTGWVPMASMSLIYDYQSFVDEYKGEFEKFTGDVSDYIDGDKMIYCWKYPGAEKICDRFYPTEFNGEMGLDFSLIWRDEEGRIWGNIRIYYDVRECWVCLSDPENDSLPAVQRGDPIELTPTDEAKVERGVRGLRYQNNNMYLSLALSLVVICVGAIVYILLKKKSGKNEK